MLLISCQRFPEPFFWPGRELLVLGPFFTVLLMVDPFPPAKGRFVDPLLPFPDPLPSSRCGDTVAMAFPFGFPLSGENETFIFLYMLFGGLLSVSRSS